MIPLFAYTPTTINSDAVDRVVCIVFGILVDIRWPDLDVSGQNRLPDIAIRGVGAIVLSEFEPRRD